MKPLGAIACLVLFASALGACHAPRPSPVVIGIGMPWNSHAGLRLAADEINAAGGIDGVRLELAGLDGTPGGDSYDPRTVLDSAARFAGLPGLVAVIGHSDSASTLAAAASYNREGIPQIVTVATNPAITNIGTWTYRLCLSDAAQGPGLASYAVTDWKKKRIAIMYVNDDYGRGLARLFEDRARSLGAEIVATVMHHNALQPEDQGAIRDAVVEMRKAGADLAVLLQRVDAALWTVRTIREAGLRVDILGGDNLAQYSFARGHTGLTDGIRVSQFLNLDTRSARVTKFVDGIRAATKQDPDYAQAFAYDAIYLLRDAIRSGGYTRSGVKSYLDRIISERRQVEGVTGSFVLAADHDARRPLYIAEIREGRFHVLQALTLP